MQNLFCANLKKYLLTILYTDFRAKSNIIQKLYLIWVVFMKDFVPRARAACFPPARSFKW